MKSNSSSKKKKSSFGSVTDVDPGAIFELEAANEIVSQLKSNIASSKGGLKIVLGSNQQMKMNVGFSSQIQFLVSQLKEQMINQYNKLPLSEQSYDILNALKGLDDISQFQVDQIAYVYNEEGGQQTIQFQERLMTFSLETPFFFVNEITCGNSLERIVRKFCRSFVINQYLRYMPVIFFGSQLPECHTSANVYLFLSTGYYWKCGFDNMLRLSDILSRIPTWKSNYRVTSPKVNALPLAYTRVIDPSDKNSLFTPLLLNQFNALTQELGFTFFNPFILSNRQMSINPNGMSLLQNFENQLKLSFEKYMTESKVISERVEMKISKMTEESKNMKKNFDDFVVRTEKMEVETEKMIQESAKMAKDRETIVQECAKMVKDREIIVQEAAKMAKDRETIVQECAKMVKDREFIAQEAAKMAKDRETIVQECAKMAKDRETMVLETAKMKKTRIRIEEKIELLDTKIDKMVSESATIVKEKDTIVLECNNLKDQALEMQAKNDKTNVLIQNMANETEKMKEDRLKLMSIVQNLVNVSNKMSESNMALVNDYKAQNQKMESYYCKIDTIVDKITKRFPDLENLEPNTPEPQPDSTQNIVRKDNGDYDKNFPENEVEKEKNSKYGTNEEESQSHRDFANEKKPNVDGQGQENSSPEDSKHIGGNELTPNPQGKIQAESEKSDNDANVLPGGIVDKEATIKETNP